MIMMPDEVLRQVESLQDRLLRARQRVRFAESEQSAKQVVEEVRQTIEEIGALHEQLVEQNRALAAARGAAEDERERYRNLFEAAPDAYLVTDNHGIIREANQSAAALFRAESLIGKDLARFISAQELQQIIAEALAHAREGARLFELRLRPRGRAIDVFVSVAADQGENSLLWLIRDFSERKQTEETLRTSERLATMGATALLLLQEISNPLNDLFTTIQQLEHDLTDRTESPLRATVRNLTDESRRLRGLMQRFRSLSRPVSLRIESLDLCSVLGELIDVEKRESAERGIDINHIFFRQPIEVKADYERLRQAFANLLKNAKEAMPHGGRITVHGYSRRDEAVVEIGDTGAGVAKGIDIFNLFTTTKFQAMGMGLPIARQIVHDYGGKITFSSLPGRTIFRVVLPISNSRGNS